MSSDEELNYSRSQEQEVPLREDELSSQHETDSDNCALEESFGPALPPHLIEKKKKHETCYSDADSTSKREGEDSSSPSPPENSRKQKEPGELSPEAKEVYGPQIPNYLREKIMGPAIPAHLEQAVHVEDETSNAEPDCDPGYGPSLSLMADAESGVSRIPSSFGKSKEKVQSEKSTKRESWMLELPPERAATFGFGPRQFRTKLPNEKDCDRSGWTETPTSKGKEPKVKDDLKIIRQKEINERDKEMERLVRKMEKKKKREKSLLEIHRKKLEKKKKKEAKQREKEGKTVERRPFDRNIDLQVNRFDESQKRAVLRKAQLLNDRFAQGESKFL